MLSPRVLFRRVRTFRRLKVKLNRRECEDSPEQDMEASLTKVLSPWPQVTTTLLRKTKRKSWYPYPNLAAEGPSLCQRTSILGFPGKRKPSFTPCCFTQPQVLSVFWEGFPFKVLGGNTPFFLGGRFSICRRSLFVSFPVGFRGHL